MMNKSKIAISIDPGLLDELDKLIDGERILSRSQAIEILLKDSLRKKPVTSAVMLIKKEDMGLLFNKVHDGISLLDLHVDFLFRNGVKDLYVITEQDELLKDRVDAIENINITLVDEKKSRGTASALNLIKEKINSTFLVFNGDTFNDFDLKKMIASHLGGNTAATIGLISSANPSTYGSAVLDGNLIVDFTEKGDSHSHVINAGIYLFGKDIFNFFDKETRSLERDLFPKLAKLGQLQGFFTHGEYHHLEN